MILSGIVLRFLRTILSYSLSNSKIRSLFISQDNNLWIGTTEGNLNYLDFLSEPFMTWSHGSVNKSGLSHSSVNAIHKDRSDCIWIGTNGGGLNKIAFDESNSSPHITTFLYNPDDEKSLSHNQVYAICEDQAGNLWIGTRGGGLNLLPSNHKDDAQPEFIRYQNDPENANSLSNNNIRSMIIDRDDNLWIGTENGGLNQFILSKRNHFPEKFIIYQNEPDNISSLSSNDVRSLYEDRSGNLWIGTASGLNQLKSDSNLTAKPKIIRYQHKPGNPHSLSHKMVYSIMEDSRGVLWVGTGGGGLNKLER